MDDFDILLKQRAKQETVHIPDNVENRIKQTLDNISVNRKNHKKTTIAVAVAIIIIMIPVMTVNSRELPLISSIIDYFQGNTAQRYSGDAAVFEKYAVWISKTVTDNGVSVSIDNIACDGNFLVLFYTVTGDVEKTFEDIDGQVLPKSLYGQIKINGQKKEISNNDRYNYDSYVTPEGLLKGIIRVDISREKLTPESSIELTINDVCGKKGNWRFNLCVSPTAILKESKVVTVNKEACIKYPDREHHIKIERVSFSPFGNQILISEPSPPIMKNREYTMFCEFALFDDQGQAVDILPVQSVQMLDRRSGIQNSFEFIKCNKDTKFLTLVPMHFTGIADPPRQALTIEKLPLELKTINTGSIVINRIDFSDLETRVYYTKKGVIMPLRQYFNLVDQNGQFIYARMSSIVDRKQGIYVAVFPELDSSKEYKISCYIDNFRFDLLYDYKVEIHLE